MVTGLPGTGMSTKDHILSHLKEQKGNWVSGPSIGAKVAVSRTAIWKHVRTLKEEGYDITSAPKKGYLLRQVPDLLLPHEIREDLDKEDGRYDLQVYL